MARIFITGAADGLGRALARKLADAGHRLVRHGRDATRPAQAYDPAFRARLRELTDSLVPADAG